MSNHNTPGVPEPEVSATAQRKATAAGPSINQVPDNGLCYEQTVEGVPNAQAVNVQSANIG